MRRPSQPRASPGSRAVAEAKAGGVAPPVIVRDEIGEQLTGWGTVARLVTRGRVSGEEVTAAVGFVDEPDGSLLVAAGSPEAGWARNLEAEPRCRAEIGDLTFDAVAEPLEGTEAGLAVRGLILKYGTPAERLGRGPAFRLRLVGQGRS